VAAGLDRPVAAAHLPDGSMLVLEKDTGRVQHVRDGRLVGTALDLPVNSNTAPGAERGLLGIALHPEFPLVPRVYLLWTESDLLDESGHPVDSDLPKDAPDLGNRVDRFSWDGATLTHPDTLLRLRVRRDLVEDPSPVQRERAGHVAGVLRFGPDGKLYVLVGDVGRRGLLQNLPCGPTTTCPGPTVADDRFGGPEPDDHHLTGVVLRLEPDGSAPADNPFAAYGATVGGEVGANVRKVFAYGIRNSFGMDFDPRSGALWMQENAEDSYDELNRVDPGHNSGWVQLLGPVARYEAEDGWPALERTYLGFAGELRFPATSVAPTAEGALARLARLPGSHYSDPELSWRHPVSPAGLGFVDGRGLGPQYEGDLLMGTVSGSALLRIQLTGNRRQVAVDDPELEDRVVDNERSQRLGGSEELLLGTGFGVVTHVDTGPDGAVYLVDQGPLTPQRVPGTVYRITRQQP
jgi:glucose/arabinose dehydrogenase